MKPDVEVKEGWIKKTILRIKNGVDDPIYLIRWSLFTCPIFAIKLHKVVLSDDDCMHDHPWSFISFILRGGYVEHVYDIGAYLKAQGFSPGNYYVDYNEFDVTKMPIKKRLYGAGSILWRPQPWVHKLEVFQPAWTLVITFKKVREWGFITSTGWRIWHKYIREGRRCE